MQKVKHIIIIFIFLISILSISSCKENNTNQKEINKFINNVKKQNGLDSILFEDGWYKGTSYSTLFENGFIFCERSNETYFYGIKDENDNYKLNKVLKFYNIFTFKVYGILGLEIETQKTRNVFFENGKYKMIENYKNILNEELNHEINEGFNSKVESRMFYCKAFDRLYSLDKYRNISEYEEYGWIDDIKIEENDDEIILSISVSDIYGIMDYTNHLSVSYHFDKNYNFKYYSYYFQQNYIYKEESSFQIIYATIEKIDSCPINDIDFEYNNEAKDVEEFSLREEYEIII